MIQILHKMKQPRAKQFAGFDKLCKRLSAMAGTHYKPTADSNSDTGYGRSERTSLSIME
jgi:hypothetical protein